MDYEHNKNFGHYNREMADMTVAAVGWDTEVETLFSRKWEIIIVDQFLC